MKTIDRDTLHLLPLHEIIEHPVNQYIYVQIMRVLGGWIYTTFHMTGTTTCQSSVFVPLI
jgi:hypothetical protein